MQNMKRALGTQSEKQEISKKKKTEDMKGDKANSGKKIVKKDKNLSQPELKVVKDKLSIKKKPIGHLQKSKLSGLNKDKNGKSGNSKDGMVKKSKDGSFRKGKVGGFQKNKGDFKKGKPGAPTEKPVWSEMKKQKKELRLERRKTKATALVFEVSHKAKGLATQIQRKIIQAPVKEKLCLELHELLKGQYKTIALTHDLSRVIQVLLKYSNEKIRSELTEELLPIMVPMAQSKYAQHSVKRILKYGTDSLRVKVLERFLGSVVSLATHVVSAPVLDFAYSEHATNKQKYLMQQEFYGDMFKNSKDMNVKSLSDAYKDSPEMKEAILSTCKSNIQRVLDKNLHDGELLHAVLFQYMTECNSAERTELITSLSPLIVPLSNSLPGVNAASLCVWHGTNKDKKTILKVVKEHAVALSTHKTGYRLLIAIFDSVDDTVLVKKTIISTLAKHVKNIAKEHWGKMTLHWLVRPADPAAFHPSFVRQVREGAATGSSKKDADTRAAELRAALLPAICDNIESDPQFWMLDPAMALLTVTVLTSGVPKKVMSSITNVICRPNWKLNVEGKEVLGIEDAGMHVCLKKIAQRDRDAEVTFGDALADELSDETLTIWLKTNRGCFLLLKTIENNSKDVVQKLVNKIKPHVKILESQTTQGAKLLLKNI